MAPMQNINLGRTQYLGLFTAIVVGFAFSITGLPINFDAPLLQQDSPGENVQSVNEDANYMGLVQITHERDIDQDGEYETIQSTEAKPNLITDQGLNFIQYSFSGTGAPNSEVSQTDEAIYIGLSNESSPEASDTSLQGEFTTGGLSRKQGTTVDQGVGNYSVWATFTASQTFYNVNMTGLFWNNTASSPSLVAENDFVSTNLLDDDQITVNWTEISISN